jgi:hypothetical protein
MLILQKIGSSRAVPAIDWFPRAIVAGCAASTVMLIGFVLAYGVAAWLVAAPLAEPPGAGTVKQWLYALTHNTVLDTGLASLYVAVAIYFLGGLAWAVLYARFAEPRWPGPAWTRGVAFSIVPAAVSVVVVLPLLGGGWLGLGLGAGPLPLLGNVLLHALYGAILGLLYGPFGQLSAETLQPCSREELLALAAVERVTARAILLGLLIGAVIGGVGMIAAALRQEPNVLGVAPASFALAALVSGATLGAALGPLIGQPGTHEQPL